jgi:serine/threonine-protein kinase
MLEPGRVIAGRYRIEGVLGRGGMGFVVAGQQLDLERPVAIKLLRPNLARDARPSQRFAREARAIAKMRSEHVVRVFDVAEEAGIPFIVMERLRGHDLAQELAGGPLSVAVTVEYMLQACEAVAEAHSLGIVHRDLKPSNLFLAEGFAGRRTLKVLDFGVSKWLGPAPDLATPLSTSEGSFIGTPAYVSPEQLTRPESVDSRADVWAMGVVLYQCVSGCLPFEADSVPRLCAEILTAKPRPFDPSLSIPGGLEQVIRRCLCKDLERRYANISELAQALRPYASPGSLHLLDSIEALSRGDGSEQRASQSPAPSAAGAQAPQTTLTFSHVPSRSSKSRARWLTAVPLAAAIILVAAALAQRWTQAPPRPEESLRAGSASASARAAIKSPEPIPSSTPVSTAAVAPTTPSATPQPRVTRKLTQASTAASARPRATPAPSATVPSAQPPASSAVEAKPPEPSTKPAVKPSGSDTIDPSQLYRR